MRGSPGPQCLPEGRIFKSSDKLKGKFSCQYVLFKTWIRIKKNTQPGTTVTTLGYKMVLLAQGFSL